MPTNPLPPHPSGTAGTVTLAGVLKTPDIGGVNGSALGRQSEAGQNLTGASQAQNQRQLTQGLGQASLSGTSTTRPIQQFQNQEATAAANTEAGKGIERQSVKWLYSSANIRTAHQFYLRAQAAGVSQIVNKYQPTLDKLNQGISQLQEKQGFHPLDTLASALGGVIGGGFIGGAVAAAGSVIGQIAGNSSIDDTIKQLQAAVSKVTAARESEIAAKWPTIIPIGCVKQTWTQTVNPRGATLPPVNQLTKNEVGQQALPLWALRETVLHMIQERMI